MRAFFIACLMIGCAYAVPVGQGSGFFHDTVAFVQKGLKARGDSKWYSGNWQAGDPVTLPVWDGWDSYPDTVSDSDTDYESKSETDYESETDTYSQSDLEEILDSYVRNSSSSDRDNYDYHREDDYHDYDSNDYDYVWFDSSDDSDVRVYDTFFIDNPPTTSTEDIVVS